MEEIPSDFRVPQNEISPVAGLASADGDEAAAAQLEAESAFRAVAAVLDYARPGDTIVVVGIDRLGRNAAEVMTTIRDLGERGIVLRSLREGIDTSNATGRMFARVLASLAKLELELGRECRAASRAARKARDMPIGRPKKLDATKAALARRMRDSGEPVPLIADQLNVSRATLYRYLAEID
jgi:DNA invertase Pin-like site-specific DNA recombinase